MTLPNLRPLPAIGAIALRAGRSLQDSSMIDRLMRGRAWIGLLGALLIGLVALNVSLLKLNAEAGRNAEVAKKLRIENADLRSRVSRLGSGNRLEDAAQRLGLVMPTAGSVQYLVANPAIDGRRAARHAELTPLPLGADIVSAQSGDSAPAPVSIVPAATTAPIAGTPAAGTVPPGATAGSTGPAAPTTAGQTAPPQTTPPTSAPQSGGGTAPPGAAPAAGALQP